MAWIELHQGIHRHRKITAAARLLDIPRMSMIGHLTSLWLWAIDNAPNGKLGAISCDEIALAAEWDCDPNVFVNTLKKVGLLDKRPLAIHDWRSYAGKLIEARAKNTDRMAKARAGHIQDTSGARAGHVQDTSGARAEHVQDTSGARAGHVQDTSGARAEHVQGLPYPTVPYPTVPEQEPSKKETTKERKFPISSGSDIISIFSEEELLAIETRFGCNRDDISWEAEKCFAWWSGEGRAMKNRKLAFKNWLGKASVNGSKSSAPANSRNADWAAEKEAWDGDAADPPNGGGFEGGYVSVLNQLPVWLIVFEILVVIALASPVAIRLRR